jgi:hypothetical protein
MAKLAEILKQEYQTKNFAAGVSSATGKYLREKLDIRNILFSSGGIGSVIGKKLFGKGYSALSKASPIPKSLKDDVSTSTQSVDNVLLKSMASNLKVMAKSIIVLPYMARDINITKLNMMKMVKLMGGKSTRNTDMFFKDAKERENIYEAQFRKSGGTKGLSPSVIGKEKDKETESIIDDIIAGTLLAKLIEKIIPITLSVLKKASIVGGLIAIAALVREAFDRGIIGNKGLSDQQNFLITRDIGKLKSEKDIEAAVKEAKKKLTETGEKKFSKEQIDDIKSGKKIFYEKVNPDTGKQSWEIETPEQALKHLNEMQNRENKPLSKMQINGKNIESGVKAAPSKVYDETLPRGQTISSSQIIDFFVKEGYTKEQAAGIAGNLMEESSLNTGAQAKEPSDGSISYGLAQWNKSRLTDLKKFAEDHNAKISDPNIQLKFIAHELNSKEYAGAKQSLMSAKTPEQSASVFANQYEKHGTPSSDPKRQNNAVRALNQYKIDSKSPIASPVPESNINKDVESGKSNQTKPKVPLNDALGSINKPTMSNEPKIQSGRIETASNNVEDIKRETTKNDSPMIVNAPVTNNNMKGGGGGSSKGYDTAKTRVYDTDLINLLQRTA